MTSIPTRPTDSAAPLKAPAEGSRRAEIALMAAEEFTRRGYHSTRVEHIAERLSVTPGALYRHVPGKYEMFRDAVATLATDLETASRPAPTSTGAPPSLEVMVEAITRTTLRHRTRAALYRWQARYLTPEDRAAVVEVDAQVRRRLADAIRERRQRRHRHRSHGAGSAAAAILSCIASLGHHRIELSADEAVALMTSIADDLAMSVPPPRPDPAGGSDPPDGSGATVSHPVSGPGSASRGVTGPGASNGARNGPGQVAPPRLRGGAATREGALDAAIARFHSSGYDSVTMEAIGADVGVAASALYRHFSGKSALLTAAVDRTATLVEELLDGHAVLHGAGTDPTELLDALLGQYVSIAFSHGPDLMLYHSELGALGTEDRRRLRRAQRRQLDRWAGLVVDAAPQGEQPAEPAPGGEGRSHTQTEEAMARIRVHAALAVVLDGGQGTQFRPAVAPRFAQLAGIVLIPR